MVDPSSASAPVRARLHAAESTNALARTPLTRNADATGWPPFVVLPSDERRSVFRGRRRITDVKAIALTAGDPSGIGPEIVRNALEGLPTVPLIVIGDLDLTRAALDECGLNFPWEVVDASRLPGINRAVFLPTPPGESTPLQVGVANAHSGAAALASIDLAADLAATGVCDAIVTAPISKTAIQLAGSTFPGHTELLAEKSGLRRYAADFAMIFDSPRLRVALLSVHVPLRGAVDLLEADKIASLGMLLDRELPRITGRKPRVLVAGLNPHAGEDGLFGDEERVIVEGVKKMRELGVDAEGPVAPDTAFLRSLDGAYDVVVAMYHDQGLIPVKTLDFERSVNVTIGLPYLRVSVDHGTAFDIAGKGVANSRPMKSAIEWALEHQMGWSR